MALTAGGYIGAPISINGAVGAGGGAGPIVAKTTSYSVLLSENGYTFTNTGAAGAVTFTMPANAPAGFTATFIQDSATQNIVIQMPVGETLRLSPILVSSSGGTATWTGAAAASQGCTLTVVKVGGAVVSWSSRGFLATLPTLA